ncbi:MAG: archaemetzincin [Proteobacteria bacterium]|nr:archaemetzincin [Pseudomonadota bacterium]
MNIDSKHKIIISPIGNIDAKIIGSVKKVISHRFGFQAMVKPLLENIGFAFDPGRNQHNSTSILGKLESCAPEYALKVLAVTDVDLFIPILTHVYGEAQLGGRTSIVSIYRLKDCLSGIRESISLPERIVKEAIHELGHTFNLLHCKDHSCIMHYCRTEKDVDRKSDQLCRYCKILLDDEIKRLRP